ncbi:CcdC protein domain-containing protein [Fictibacillus barbaricus]|uniref:Membrane protein CcdC involved in cytochrome C biogenesis n=1 Tax=Fictibacillus barbaricus TaxID=182136 RepID=A0ABU1U371_9BACL|nr:CcdC protein domain-containing protein [Fictibacillus barbaricus]MDR7073919.1 membrane protein CcdC involved in cytochrome C biogenesis [Fictibacillus barbaricus]
MTTSPFYLIVILIACLVLWRRTRSMYRPIKGKGGRLLFPILFFIPAIQLLVSSKVHLSLWSDLGAILLGLILSIPLIWTTRYEVREDQLIYAKKDFVFVVAFLVVLAIRFILRRHFGYMDAYTLSALFTLVAISYIVPWRIISFLKFRKIYRAAYQANYKA